MTRAEKDRLDGGPDDRDAAIDAAWPSGDLIH
jgi:hypothetical protein